MGWFASLAVGAALSFAIGSPVEWAVHKYILHGRKRNFLNRAAAVAHNDVHHRGFSGPAHYYRDVTNEHVTIHFSKGDVAVIELIGGFVGVLIAWIRSLIVKSSLGTSDVVFVLGFMLGIFLYYFCYEFMHHYMHVIGKRRLAINKELGKVLQGKSDGRLRFPKSLLDDICNNVELIVDGYKANVDAILVKDLQKNIVKNRKNGIRIAVSAQQALSRVTAKMIRRERRLRSTLTGRFSYWKERKLQKFLRNSRVFQYLDNHHFVHHSSYQRNLNVAVPLMDYIARTKIDSSRKALETPQYLLCPNSPDVKKFA